MKNQQSAVFALIVTTCQNRFVAVSCITPTEPCENQCVCKDGRIRNAKNECVPIEKCEPKCAGPNEVYTTCKKSCPPETCFSLVARFSCDGSEPCRNGCVCKPGFLRKSLDSPCVPICQCPEMKHSPDCENKS
uniref:SFRICE_004256 n=1 Tax=Spodoptera frugiperda TaxID=7108 RepID=A0A2H1VNI2_SPOFR